MFKLLGGVFSKIRGFETLLLALFLPPIALLFLNFFGPVAIKLLFLSLCLTTFMGFLSFLEIKEKILALEALKSDEKKSINNLEKPQKESESLARELEAVKSSSVAQPESPKHEQALIEAYEKKEMAWQEKVSSLARELEAAKSSSVAQPESPKREQALIEAYEKKEMAWQEKVSSLARELEAVKSSSVAQPESPKHEQALIEAYEKKEMAWQEKVSSLARELEAAKSSSVAQPESPKHEQALIEAYEKKEMAWQEKVSNLARELEAAKSSRFIPNLNSDEDKTLLLERNFLKKENAFLKAQLEERSGGSDSSNKTVDLLQQKLNEALSYKSSYLELRNQLDVIKKSGEERPQGDDLLQKIEKENSDLQEKVKGLLEHNRLLTEAQTKKGRSSKKKVQDTPSSPDLLEIASTDHFPT